MVDPIVASKIASLPGLYGIKADDKSLEFFKVRHSQHELFEHSGNIYCKTCRIEAGVQGVPPW